ncbi:MAG: site-specific integrase, partial [Pseudomonadota bacterium]
MAVVKRGQTWSLRFRPFGGDVIGLATLAKTKFEAQGIEREILLACRARDYSCLSKEAREACLRMFKNQGWEPPPGLVKTEPDKLTLRRAFEIFAQSLKVKNDPGKERHEISQFHLEEYFGKGTNVENIWVPELEQYQAKRLADGRAPGTINREMVTMSKLFTVLEQHRMVKQNPVHLLQSLSTKGSERRVYISFEDVTRIAEA